MKIAFRVDASLSIGSGHIIRCLNLADALRKNGVECVFITKAHLGHLNQLITARSFNIYVIQTEIVTTDEYILDEKEWLGGSQHKDALKVIEIFQHNKFIPDAIVIDHYSLDIEWESSVYKHFPHLKIIAIDDLCNRKHFCHILIDVTLERNQGDYKNLVPEDSLLLLGTRYALLKEEFAQLRNKAISKRRDILIPKKILITMGGVDINNMTGYILNEINNNFEIDIDLITVIVGLNCPHKKEINRIANSLKYPVEVKENIDDMPQVMLDHDVSIGALGSTTWERGVLGLPTINVVIADNQLVIVEKLKNSGFIVFSNANFSGEELYQAWKQLNNNYPEMVTRSFALCDGRGLKRVVASIMSLLSY